MLDLPLLNKRQKRNILNAQRLFNLKPTLSEWKLKSRAARATWMAPREAASATGC